MPTTFWSICLAMCVSSALFVTAPLWRRNIALSRRQVVAGLSAAAGVMLLPILIYLQTGRPEVLFTDSGVARSSPMAITAGRAAGGSRTIGSVASLVDGLARRLQEDPGDGGGWLLLARSYRHLDRKADAAAAYRRAAGLGRSDRDLEAYLAVGERAYAAEVTGRVDIDPGLRASLDDSATVFVFARDSSGSGMPMAVVRTTVAQLPWDFRMTASDFMVDTKKLAAGTEIVVTAGIAADGSASSIGGTRVSSGPVMLDHPGFLELKIAAPDLGGS